MARHDLFHTPSSLMQVSVTLIDALISRVVALPRAEFTLEKSAKRPHRCWLTRQRATRLDIPTHVEEIFEPTRWAAVIATFALICRFWYEHYRIFRHHFVAASFDMIVNFVFLFAIAVLPYSVQIFLHFQVASLPFILYIGDLCLVLTPLSVLRVRSLSQRRENTNDASRLNDWRRSLAQFTIAGACAVFLVLIPQRPTNFEPDVRAFGGYVLPFLVVILVVIRRSIRQLPSFLQPVQADSAG